MSSHKICRLGILISGRGSNMIALSNAVREGKVGSAEVGLIVSDQNAPGIKLAQDRGLETLVIERSHRTRQEHEQEILAALGKHKIDLVCLAGYMRLLSPGFITAYPGLILNIHPSLLPAFPGLDAQRQAVAHGVKWSGCTVHVVDETLDGGPIVAQRVVPVLDDDTEETLAARILEQEHQLYPEAVALIASGKYEMVGRRVRRKQ